MRLRGHDDDPRIHTQTLSCAQAWRMDDDALREVFARIVGRLVLDAGAALLREVMPFLAERRDGRSMTRAEMLMIVKQHEDRFNPPRLRTLETARMTAHG
jgi:hypothetical protein